MKRWLVFALIALLLVVQGETDPVTAQADLRLETLRVGLWPEYDRAALLVIYWGALPEDTAFPATVSLRIPASVAAPHVVAAQADPDAGVDEVDYAMADAGDWRVITFQANGPRFQFEYYDALARDGSTRAPSYTWPGDYPVELLRIELQHPPHADDLTTDPDLPLVERQAADGLLYHSGEFGPLDAGETLELAIRYTRDEDALTVALLAALPPAEASGTGGEALATAPPESSGLSGEELLLLVAVAVGSFLLGAASMRLAINWQTRR